MDYLKYLRNLSAASTHEKLQQICLSSESPAIVATIGEAMQTEFASRLKIRYKCGKLKGKTRIEKRYLLICRKEN